MNNKGFAITTILYGILILFLMLLVSMLGILSTYKDRLGMLIDNNNGARDIINGKSNTDTADLYVDGKSGSFEITPTAYKTWSSGKIRITWEEKYNRTKNTSIIYITNFELWSDVEVTNMWVGGGDDETKGLFINDILVQRMTYSSGATGFPWFSGNKWVSLNNIPAPFPWTSGELTHNADGTLTVPIMFDGMVTPSNWNYYASFSNVVTDIVLTDTRE